MTEPIIVTDISKWNDGIDFAVMRNAGARGVVIRVGSRDAFGNYADFQFAENITNAPAHMDYIGGYFFVRPEYDPISQANFFLAMVSGLPFDFLVADCEVIGPAAAYKAFCIQVKANTDKPVLLYSNLNAWQNKISGDKSWHTLFEKWVASWGTTNPTMPPGWTTYVGHQYSAEGNKLGTQYGAPPPPAADADMDLSRFDADWLAQFDQPAPEPQYYAIGKGAAIREIDTNVLVGIFPPEYGPINVVGEYSATAWFVYPGTHWVLKSQVSET